MKKSLPSPYSASYFYVKPPISLVRPYLLHRTAILEYIEYQSVCPFVGIGSHHHPLTRKRVCIPPWTQRGRGATVQHSLRGEGVHGGHNSLEGKPGTLYTLCRTPYRYNLTLNWRWRKQWQQQKVFFSVKSEEGTSQDDEGIGDEQTGELHEADDQPVPVDDGHGHDVEGHAHDWSGVKIIPVQQDDQGFMR